MSSLLLEEVAHMLEIYVYTVCQCEFLSLRRTHTQVYTSLQDLKILSEGVSGNPWAC